MKKIIKKILPNTQTLINKLLIKELRECKRVIDLGCGPSSPLKYLKGKEGLYFESIGVDVFEPYILENIEKKESIHSEYIKSNILDIEFPDKYFDCALMLDVIEHIDKTDFSSFLARLEKMAKKIIVITPNGFIKQKEYDKNKFQIHKSGWSVNEMKKLGFECHGLSGLKYLRGEEWQPKIKPKIFGEFICNLTQIITKYIPRLSYHLVCIKKTK